MRLSSIRYLLREGFRSIWQNRFMAIASVGVLVSCLLLTGGSYLVFANIQHGFDMIDSQNVAIVYAEKDATQAQLDALGEEIRRESNVSKVEFLSREEQLKRYESTFSRELFEELEQKNPLLDAYVVTFADLEKFSVSIMHLEAMEHVDSVSYSNEVAETLTRLRSIVLIAGGWVIILLLVVSLFIISNTIKLTVYNRRLEIGIMKSVGATNTFIRVPFLVEGMALGLIAGVLTFGITYFIYHELEGMFDFGAFVGGLIPFADLGWLLGIGYVAAGMLTGVVGSAIAMGKYLKNEGGIVLD